MTLKYSVDYVDIHFLQSTPDMQLLGVVFLLVGGILFNTVLYFVFLGLYKWYHIDD